MACLFAVAFCRRDRLFARFRVTLRPQRAIVQYLNHSDLDESCEFGVVVSCVVEVEAGFFIEDLAGEAVGDFEGVGVVLVVFLAVGGVAVVLDEIAFAVTYSVFVDLGLRDHSFLL